MLCNLYAFFLALGVKVKCYIGVSGCPGLEDSDKHRGSSSFSACILILKINCMLESLGFKQFCTMKSPLQYFSELRPGTHVDPALHVRQGHPPEHRHN